MASHWVVPLDHRSDCPNPQSSGCILGTDLPVSGNVYVCFLLCIYPSRSRSLYLPIRIGKSIQVEESFRTEVEENGKNGSVRADKVGLSKC